MVQLTILLTLICIVLALAIFAGAFYLAKYVVSIQHRVAVLEDSYKEATEYIEEKEKQIIQLQQELDFVRRDVVMAEQRNHRFRAWDPSDPLNAGERERG